MTTTIPQPLTLAYVQRVLRERAGLLRALKEAHRYFRNRVGNEEVQLNEMIGAVLAQAEREESP
jgi:hypothetical protein